MALRSCWRFIRKPLFQILAQSIYFLSFVRGFLPITRRNFHRDSSSLQLLKPTTSGVASAYGLLSQHNVIRTPLLEYPLLNKELGTRVLLKSECLQTTGSFKYRGALHRILRLPKQDSAKGVVAFRSGNFGMALAAAATSVGIPCCVISPHDAPPVKLDRIRGFGAELVLSTATGSQNREVVASKLAEEISTTRGMTLLHPFEDVDVIHGQGTCGMELIEQAEEILGSKDELGTIVVPCGGGGLTAGICLAVEEQRCSANIITIEPKGFDDHAKSFLENKRQTLAEIYPSPVEGRSEYCDALMAGAPGIATWEVNQPRLANALSSTGDTSVAQAMKVAFEQYRLVLEPSGALGLAALLDGQIDLGSNKAVAVIASGGNTDLEVFQKLMARL